MGAPVVKSEVKTVGVKAPAVTYAYHGYPYTYGYHPFVVTKPVEAEAVEAERKKGDADPAVLATSTRVVSPVTYAYTYGSPYAYSAFPYARLGFPYAYYHGK